MKLSDAMRLGALLKPQCFGALWDARGSCALGAAYDAIGHGYANTHCNFALDDDASNWFPILRRAYYDWCPAQQCRSNECGDVLGTIAHLNDAHHWTREQIADWVETIERGADAAIEVAAVACGEGRR